MPAMMASCLLIGFREFLLKLRTGRRAADRTLYLRYFHLPFLPFSFMVCVFLCQRF